MTLESLYTILNSISTFSGKVAYNTFPAGDVPSLPFIVYLETGLNAFSADGITYFSTKKVDIELYEESRNACNESLIEAALNNAGIYFGKSSTWLEDEKCFEIIYTIEV